MVFTKILYIPQTKKKQNKTKQKKTHFERLLATDRM